MPPNLSSMSTGFGLFRNSSLLTAHEHVANSYNDAYTAISRKVVGEKVLETIPKGNVGHDRYTVPDTVAVEPAFVAFL